MLLMDCTNKDPKTMRTCIEQGAKMVSLGVTTNLSDQWCVSCQRYAYNMLQLHQVEF